MGKKKGLDHCNGNESGPAPTKPYSVLGGTCAAAALAGQWERWREAKGAQE